MAQPRSVQLAGKTVSDPLGVLRAYAERPDLQRTVINYDLPGPGSATLVTLEEAGARTRRIASRVSNVEAQWFADRSSDPAVVAAMEAVPVTASLTEADPLQPGALYDNASALYEAFRAEAPPGVAVGKIHKVLHVKRPALVPILDSKLRHLYAPVARQWRDRLWAERGLVGHGYWAAIRADLCDPSNAPALKACRAQLTERGDALSVLSELSDLRLLDILAWSASQAFS